MKNKLFRTIYGVIFSTILTFSLLLTGCGQSASDSNYLSVENKENSQKQTVSTDIEVSRTSGGTTDIEISATIGGTTGIEVSAATGKATESGESETIDEAAKAQAQTRYEALRDKQLSEMLREDGFLPIEEEQAVADGKTVLTLLANLPSTYLDNIVVGFNRQSTDYFIRLERETGDTERVLTEIIAGRGPDIISGEVFKVTESILKQGVLVDLAPGLDAMGITDKDYFPAFRELRMGNGIYGIRTSIDPDGRWIRKEVLGSTELPDIETLVEKLYTYPDQDAVWAAYSRTESILEYLLCGSEDLWGMIDWENGTCDFSGELFAKMLMIAKRYMDPEGLTIDTPDRWLIDYYHPMFEPREKLETEGKVIINFLFDDGNYPTALRLGDTIMLNANSKHQEGAWEFLKYLLSDEAQAYAANGYTLVASKEMSLGSFEYYLQKMKEGNMSGTSDLTPEVTEELFAFIEQTRPTPLHTKEILSIIYEEAAGYCEGNKPLEEVCRIIQSRVWLYISENM